MFVHVGHGGIGQHMVHAHDEAVLQPSARVEVAVEVIDLNSSVFGIVYQAHQSHISWKDVTVADKLTAHEIQRVFPECAAGLIQQHNRHQWAFARLDQREYFQGFVQRAETTGTEHQRIGLFDKDQLAHEEEVKRQQVDGAIYRRIGMLLEG